MAATWACTLGAVVATIGLLFLLRAPARHFPGPKLTDALPLDELSNHAFVHLPLYLTVCAMSAVLLGLLVRRLAFERLSAAVVLALGVGFWHYVADAISLFSVRQVPMRQALSQAATLPALYIAAGIAGLGGALFGRAAKRRRPRVQTMLALLVAAAGILDVLSAITPEIGSRLTLLEQAVPRSIPPVASAATVPAGVALVLVARGLERGKRRAWWLAVGLLSASSILHMLKGLDFEEAAITGGLALALVAQRHQFDAAGDPSSSRRAATWVIAFLGIAYVYGAAALWVNRSLVDRPWSPEVAFTVTTHAVSSLGLASAAGVGGRFGAWFPLSVAFLAAGGVLAGVLEWLRPWRYHLRREESENAVARRLVRDWGVDSLAPFTLRADKSHFFSEDGSAFLAYTVAANVALVSGEPVGPQDAVGPLIRRFLSFAAGRDWKVAFLGTSARHLELYRTLGLRVLYWGDEGVIDSATFSLEGRAIRKVRQSVHRLDRDGYRPEVLYAGELTANLRAELQEVERSWRGSEDRGSVMCMDDLTRLDGGAALFVLGRDSLGAVGGFLHLAVCDGRTALTLSSMPRRRDAVPNGFNEWLIVNTILWARDHGFKTVSLNFAPFARLLDPDASLNPLQHVGRAGLMALKSRLHLQLDNLRLFTGQLLPDWRPRYVVYERRLDLPWIGVAGLAAEGYLPRAANGRA